MNKGRELYNNIKLEIVFCANKNLEKINYENFKTISDIINNSIYVPKSNKSLVCCWSKVPQPQKLNLAFNFKYKVNELRSLIGSFKKQLSSSITSKEELKIFNIEKLKDYIKEDLNNKIDYLFKLNQINDKLKDEVDKYWEYYNVKKIISKQLNKIKLQNSKLNFLEEAHMLNECIICMESERNIIFYPCRHLICCETCSFGKIGNDCPECHSKIENKQITLT